MLALVTDGCCCCWWLLQVKDEIAKYKVGAPARVGLVAPNDVFVPAGGTGEGEEGGPIQPISLTADGSGSNTLVVRGGDATRRCAIMRSSLVDV